MPIIPDGFAQVNFVFTGGAVPTGAEVTFGLNIEEYGNPPASLAEDVGTAFFPVMGELNAGVNLTAVRAKYGPSITGPSGEFAFSEGGGDGGAASTPGLAWLVHKTTSLGGRAGRGRMYLPGLSEADVGGDGSISETPRALLEADLATFMGDLTSLLLIPVVLHGDESPISLPTAITSLNVDSLAATQRRRMRR
jgi:hypothetical protein